MLPEIKRIHFVGIGGSGMNGLAEIFINMGYKVTGSDMKDSENTKRIRSLGGKVFIGHKSENVGNAEVLVYSNAVPDTNPEMQRGKEMKIPVIPRAVMLNEVMRLKYGIAIAGSHGKTTTTSMLAKIMEVGKYDPTYIIGGIVKSLHGSAKAGKSKYVVVEACEAFGSFLHLNPVITGVTNIDDDHLDYYKNMDSLKQAFVDFINKTPFYGMTYLNGDDTNTRDILPKIHIKHVLFGFDRKNDICAEITESKKFMQRFKIYKYGSMLGEFELNVAGRHNVANAMLAIAIASDLGVKKQAIKAALKTFRNVERRFNIYDEKKYTIVEDYGHHPTEIRAVLETGRNVTDKNIIAIFQPHLFSRTQQLYKDFAQALRLSDYVILDNIYPAREQAIPGVTSELIRRQMKKNGYKNVFYEKSWESIIDRLKKITNKGDYIFLIGAGTINQIREQIEKGLKIK